MARVAGVRAGAARAARRKRAVGAARRGAAPARAVFFDIGDTLVERPAVGPGRRIAAALGLPAERAAVITRLVFCESFASPAALAARLRRELGLAASPQAAVAAIWRAQEEEPVEIAGATACVAAAKRAGARVGVISNIWAPYEAGFRRACPAIVPLIESWHLSYRQGVAKPDAALFRAALAAVAVPASHAVMVGDSLDKDVVPALALGMEVVWVVAGDPATPPPPRCRVARGLAEARRLVLAALADDAGKPHREPLGSTPA